MLGREISALFCGVGIVAPVLRSFARSRGESICEASVSRTFAEPTIMDLGRGLRAAVVRGLRGTAWALVACGFGRPNADTGRPAGLPSSVL
jgi:hypothetical protein